MSGISLTPFIYIYIYISSSELGIKNFPNHINDAKDFKNLVLSVTGYGFLGSIVMFIVASKCLQICVCVCVCLVIDIKFGRNEAENDFFSYSFELKV
jgi:hypothetical protein